VGIDFFGKIANWRVQAAQGWPGAPGNLISSRIGSRHIPHIVHAPFHVRAYAFGDGLVNALCAAWQESDAGFREKYFDMLRAGGARHHRELLAPFGLDAADPAFWQKGLSMIEGMIDELEAMEAQTS